MNNPHDSPKQFRFYPPGLPFWANYGPGLIGMGFLGLYVLLICLGHPGALTTALRLMAMASAFYIFKSKTFDKQLPPSIFNTIFRLTVMAIMLAVLAAQFWGFGWVGHSR